MPWQWMPGASRGSDPAAGLWLPWEEETGSGLPGMHQSIRERGLTHAWHQVRVLFSLPWHLESRALPRGNAIHPIPLPWHLAAKSFTLLSLCAEKERQIHMPALPGGGGDGFTLLRGGGVTGREALEEAQSGFICSDSAASRPRCEGTRRGRERSGRVVLLPLPPERLLCAGLCESAFLQPAGKGRRMSGSLAGRRMRGEPRV